MATIGQRIRALRKDRGFTQVSLGKAASIDQSVISDIENDKGFGADVLMRLCKALQSDPYYLMQGEDGTQATELRLLAMFRDCTEAHRKVIMETATAFANMAAKPKEKVSGERSTDSGSRGQKAA